MNKCKNCGNNFEITANDREFYEKLNVPQPTLCADCRQQRRLAFRNERNLYKTECFLCKNPIISIYSNDKPYHALCKKCWWGDKWDPLAFGRDFDFTRPFFEQFDELMKDAYLLCLFGSRNQNSDYVNQETDDKNCYLNVGGHYNEDCYYNTYALYSKNVTDGYWIFRSELCYECINSGNCFMGYYLQDCQNCSNCYFCKECTGCEHCFGCYGLKHKKFHIFNKSYSEEEYKKFIAENAYEYLKNKNKQEEIYKFYLQFPHKFAHVLNVENSYGDYMINSKNTLNGFDIENCEDCSDIFVGLDLKNCKDITSIGWGERLYECASSIELNNVQFATSTIHVNDSHYCFVCFNSDHLFGCAGMNQKKYCILNKQYTQEEYENLFPRIKEHMKKTEEWGEFFPISLSPFGYNETVANEYFPMEKEKALSEEYKWRNNDPKEFKLQKYKVPENIKEVPEIICNEILSCETCSKNYKIIAQELAFYKRLNIPVPRNCPTCRHLKRLSKINPRKIWDRNCIQCKKQIKSTYAPDRPESIYCHECYLKNIY